MVGVKKGVALGVAMVAAAISTGCANSPVAPELAAPAPRITANNDASSLSSRLRVKNEKVALVKDGYAVQAASALDLRLIAEVSAPQVTVAGVANQTYPRVQATDVKLVGNLAYVSYNYEGAINAGAMQIIDLSNVSRPRLTAEAVLGDSDANAIALDGDRIYIAGATTDERYGPACVDGVPLISGGTQFNPSLTRTVKVPSFAANGVSIWRNQVVVTSGDRGGGLSFLEKVTLTKNNFTRIDDARAVDWIDSNRAAVISGGSQGKLSIVGGDGAIQRSYNVTGLNNTLAKATVQVANGIALIGAGNGGFVGTDVNAGRAVAEVTYGPGPTNGFSLNDGYGFMANGTYGIVAGEVAFGASPSGTTVTFRKMGNLALPDKSTNFAISSGNYLFVANGMGGLKILCLH